jgi:hypothetical protein
MAKTVCFCVHNHSLSLQLSRSTPFQFERDQLTRSLPPIPFLRWHVVFSCTRAALERGSIGYLYRINESSQVDDFANANGPFYNGEGYIVVLAQSVLADKTAMKKLLCVMLLLLRFSSRDTTTTHTHTHTHTHIPSLL